MIVVFLGSSTWKPQEMDWIPGVFSMVLMAAFCCLTASLVETPELMVRLRIWVIVADIIAVRGKVLKLTVMVSVAMSELGGEERSKEKELRMKKLAFIF